VSGSFFPGVPILALTATSSTQRKKLHQLRERKKFHQLRERKKLHQQNKEFCVIDINNDLFLQFPL
jgi:hypothetical protein